MKHYIYVPGLAREEVVDKQGSFDDKIQSVFSGDPFITSAVKSLQLKGGKGIVCGKALQWLDTAKMPKRLLGDLRDNILTRQVGKQPKAPRGLDIFEFPGVGSLWCHVKEMLAQPKSQKIKGKKMIMTLHPGDMLNILGHGNPRGGSLGFRTETLEKCRKPNCSLTHRIFWSVDPVTLASLLIDEGLPKTHKKIQMVQCFGAGLKDEQYQTVQPYAERLADALKGHGYKSIRVGGAVGIVWGGNLKVSPNLIPEGERLLIKISEKEKFEVCLRWFEGK